MMAENRLSLSQIEMNVPSPMPVNTLKSTKRHTDLICTMPDRMSTVAAKEATSKTNSRSGLLQVESGGHASSSPASAIDLQSYYTAAERSNVQTVRKTDSDFMSALESQTPY